MKKFLFFVWFIFYFRTDWIPGKTAKPIQSFNFAFFDEIFNDICNMRGIIVFWDTNLLHSSILLTDSWKFKRKILRYTILVIISSIKLMFWFQTMTSIQNYITLHYTVLHFIHYAWQLYLKFVMLKFLYFFFISTDVQQIRKY